ncbi:MAG: hypothetical protein OJF51_003129 [Nitrospira sp.]|nr:MAG: hypothetical protein OJF51_003129 [Nitrospira sp.]
MKERECKRYQILFLAGCYEGRFLTLHRRSSVFFSIVPHWMVFL